MLKYIVSLSCLLLAINDVQAMYQGTSSNNLMTMQAILGHQKTHLILNNVDVRIMQWRAGTQDQGTTNEAHVWYGMDSGNTCLALIALEKFSGRATLTSPVIRLIEAGLGIVAGGGLMSATNQVALSGNEDWQNHGAFTYIAERTDLSSLTGLVLVNVTVPHKK